MALLSDLLGSYPMDDDFSSLGKMLDQLYGNRKRYETQEPEQLGPTDILRQAPTRLFPGQAAPQPPSPGGPIAPTPTTTAPPPVLGAPATTAPRAPTSQELDALFRALGLSGMNNPAPSAPSAPSGYGGIGGSRGFTGALRGG